MRPRPVQSGGTCAGCGASVWELIPAEVPDGVVVQGLEGAPVLRPREFRCVLSEALGGLVLGSTVLVGGLQGAGKSTVCAELAAVMARDLGGLAYWLDAEMTRALLADVFRRTSSPLDRIRRVPRRPDPDEPILRPIGWREALRAVPPDAVVVVIDSIQRWANGYKEQSALLESMAKLTPTVLAISHTNKRGQIAGPNAHQHDGDAVVIVKQREIIATKSRWVPTPRIVQRAAAISSKNAATSSKTPGSTSSE